MLPCCHIVDGPILHLLRVPFVFLRILIRARRTAWVLSSDLVHLVQSNHRTVDGRCGISSLRVICILYIPGHRPWHAACGSIQLFAIRQAAWGLTALPRACSWCLLWVVRQSYHWILVREYQRNIYSSVLLNVEYMCRTTPYSVVSVVVFLGCRGGKERSLGTGRILTSFRKLGKTYDWGWCLRLHRGGGASGVEHTHNGILRDGMQPGGACIIIEANLPKAPIQISVNIRIGWYYYLFFNPRC